VWVPQKKHLKVRLLAFNYGLDLNFKYILRSAELQHDLLLEVEDGPLKGLSTLIRFEDYRRKYTVMSIQSFFKAEEFPFPRFFLTFGIEIVLKNIAIKLRSYLENQKTGANP
ncbi:MAG: hypothetical protein KDD50_03850, partial [Bdellovibrionales bacterium]|nr:hypothetical protein [Bdellovibrionales bacterium]